MRCIALILCSASLAVAADPAQVPGFVAPAAGEHPRLYFRKADVAELRKRAATPEGKAIVARLKLTLGGGEAMPTRYNEAKKGYSTKGELPLGTWSLGHAAGFGLLYQLTGEAKYADLARQCMDKAMVEGVRDRDDRNAWVPASAIRTGPTLAQLALGYDLAYDGWPEDYRSKVAQQIQDFNAKGTKRGEPCSLQDSAVRGGKLGPNSNHFGCHIGGAGIAILAIKGDPGTDDGKLSQWIDSVYKNTGRALTEGFSVSGYFHEHNGPMEIATGQTFQPWLQVAKVAGGKDFISTNLSAQMVTMKYAYETVLQDGKPYIIGHAADGGYGNAHLQRNGTSHGGQFAQGFGAILDSQRPALLWTYKTMVEPTEKTEFKEFLPDDTPSMDVVVYPSRAVMALASWPIGQQPVNPATVLPKVERDAQYLRWVMRNRWQDGDDCIVSALFGARHDAGIRRLIIAGLGQMCWLDIPTANSVTGTAYVDGSAVLKGGEIDLAVDMGGSSGADVLLVLSGGKGELRKIDERGGDPTKVMKVTPLTLGGKPVTVVIVAKTQPTVAVEGDAIVVGKQHVTWKDGMLALSQTAAVLP